MADTIGDAFIAIRPDLSDLPDEIASGISNIVGEIKIAVDPTQVTGDVEAVVADAVANVTPDVPLDVTADTTGAESSIQQVVDSAAGDKIDVPVTADTTEAASEIETLVGEAVSNTIDIPVTADTGDATSNLENVTSAAEGLHGASEITAGSAAGLTTILSKIGPGGAAAATGIAALVAGTGELFSAGLDAVSAEERFNRLLGDQAEAIKRVDVGTLHTDLFNLGEQFGSTDAQVQNTSTTLFEFAKNAGASDDASSRFVDQISALSARAIALNPQLGTMTDVADSLGTRLARGGRFAASFGLSLTAAEIAQRASADAGGKATNELTLYEKAAAGAEIATERYGDSLGKTVTDGSKNAQVQVEALGAEFKNAIEEIGKPLVAPVLEVLHDAIEPGKLVGTIFADLGEVALPLVEDALKGVTPLLSGVVGILDFLEPVLSTVDRLIGDIPAPVFTAAAAYGALLISLNLLSGVGFVAKILESIGVASITTAAEVETAATEVAAAEVTIEAFNPVLLVVAATIAAVTAAWSVFSGSTDDTKDHVKQLTDALQDQNGVVNVSVAGIDKYLQTTSQFGTDTSQVDFLKGVGVSIDQVRQFAENGAQGLQQFINSLKLPQGTLITDTTIQHLISGFEDFQKVLQLTSGSQLDAAVTAGTLSQGEVDLARSHHLLADGTTDQVGALRELQPQLDAATILQNQHTDAQTNAIVTSAKNVQALQDLGKTAPGVAEALAGINTTLGSQVPGLETLAINIDHAKLTQEQIAAIAAGYGVSVNQLDTFVKGVNDAINTMTSDATSKLPPASDAIDRLSQIMGGLPKALDPKLITAALKQNIDAINGFQENLQFLFQHGGAALAAEASKEGPQVADALVKGLANKGDDAAHALNDQYQKAQDTSSNFTSWMQNQFAPQLAEASGTVAKLASDNFGNTFRIVAPTQEQLQIAYQKAALFGIPFAQALADTAGAGAVAYQQSIGQLPADTQVTLNGVQTTINDAAPGAQVAGAGVGSAANTGFGQGIGALAGHGTDIGTNIYESLTDPEVTRNINLATNVLTAALVTGLIRGLDDPNSHKATGDAMGRLVNAMIVAGQVEADSHSPSRRTMALGMNMGLGFALGMDQSTHAVTAASRRLVSAATLPARALSFAGAASTPTAALAGAASTRSGDTFVIHTTDPFVAAAEVLRKKRSQSRELQR